MPLPERIGRYQILEPAGQGSAGAVFYAWDPATRREVALKICRAAPTQSESERRLLRRMFFNEAHTAGVLDHPNILRILDAGEENGEPFIVMESVRGGNHLGEYTRAERLLAPARVIEIGYQCAKALDYAHRRGVIHRDIKPSNILMTQEGDIKIADFGIAQQTQSDATQVLGAVGSPRYMSPEQLREEPLTGQTDIYSLGVVLYELLCGEPAFQARSFGELVQTVLHEPPRPLRRVRPDLPPALEGIVDRAMRKRPADRQPDAASLARDLAEVFSIGPAVTRDDLDHHRRGQVLRELEFFRDFSDGEIGEVLAAGHWARYPAGAEVIVEGHLEHAFYILVEGCVEVRKGGTRITVLKAGDCFGEMGYLARARRTASIRALEELVLLKINSTAIERTSTSCQLRFTREFLRTLITRLARTSETLSLFAGRSPLA